MNIISRKINDYEILEYEKTHIYLLHLFTIQMPV